MRAAVLQFVTAQIHRSDSGDIAAGDDGPGDRSERLEQRFHLVVAERVERRQGKRVGSRFDAVLQVPTGRGQRPVVIEQPPLGQPLFVVMPRPARLAALTRQVHRAGKRNSSAAAVWGIAADLCQRAGDVIDGAGAVDDARARRRLLAGTKHLNRTVVLGSWVPGYQAEADNDLLQELAEADEGTKGDSGDD